MVEQVIRMVERLPTNVLLQFTRDVAWFLITAGLATAEDFDTYNVCSRALENVDCQGYEVAA